MLNGLIIDDEELLSRLMIYYSPEEIVDALGLSTEDLLSAFWDRVQDEPSVFSGVLTDIDYEVEDE